jgi:hypothetical protein
VSTRIVPGCVQFLGEEKKRFYTAWTQLGHPTFFPKQDAQPEFEVVRPLKPAIINQRSLRRIATKDD